MTPNKLVVENLRLRDWIKEHGDISDTCTRNVLHEICAHCRCGALKLSIAHPTPKIEVLA